MTTTEKKDLYQLEKHQLLMMLNDTQLELKQKKISLREARSRLTTARKKIRSLKETVDYQRKRIVDLYKGQGDQPNTNDLK